MASLLSWAKKAYYSLPGNQGSGEDEWRNKKSLPKPTASAPQGPPRSAPGVRLSPQQMIQQGGQDEVIEPEAPKLSPLEISIAAGKAAQLPQQDLMQKMKDILDANSKLDYARRNQEAIKQSKETKQPPKLDQSYREQQLDLGNKRPYDNVGAALAGNTARFLNTGEQARQEIMDTTRLLLAQDRGDMEDWRNTNQRIKERQQEAYQPNSGLFGQGTIFNSPEEMRTIGAKDLTGRVAANTLGTALEIAPFTKGAGITSKVLPKVPTPVVRTAAGSVEGGIQDVVEQQFTRDKWAPEQTAAAMLFGGVIPNAVPVVQRGANKVTDSRIPLNEVGAVGKNVNQVELPLAAGKTAPAEELPVVPGVGRTMPKDAPKIQPPGAPQTKTRTVRAAEAPEAFKGGTEPGRWAKLTNTAAATLEKYGPEGSALSQAAKAARAYAKQGKGEFFAAVPTVMKLKGDKVAKFVDALDNLSAGKKLAKNTDPEIKKAVAEWEKAIPKPLQDAIAAGVPVAGDRGKYYFPRIYKNIEKQEVFNDLVQQTMEKNKVSREEAIKAVSQLRASKIKRSGNLEKKRNLDIPGYDKSHQAIVDYIERAYDRSARAKMFGANDELVNKMKAGLQKNGIDVSPKSKFQRNLDVVRGDIDKSSGAWKASSGARKVTATTSLGTAGISNATQLNNTAAVAGILRTGKGIVKWATSKEARQSALRAGVGLDSSIKKVAEGTQGTSGKITTNIASPLFAQVEKFNREVSAIVGIDLAKKLAKKTDSTSQRILRDKLGVQGKIGKTLTPDQLKQAARGLEEKSQFYVDPMDMPGWVETPLGKMAAQFRSFGYKQTSFMWNEVLREAMVHGNFKPAMRFLAIGAPAGYAANEAKDFVKGKIKGDEDDSDKSSSQKLLEGIGTGLNQVGATGLPGFTAGSLVQGAKFGTLPQAVVSQIGGPTVGNVVETGTNVVKGQLTGNWNPLMKQGLRKVPTVGPYIANKVMPSSFQDSKPKKGEEATPAQLQKQSEEQIDKLKNRKSTEGGSLEKLPNGKFAYTLDGVVDVKTADTLEKAREAIAWHTFEKSGEQSKVIGDKHYYIDQNGNPQKEYKFKHEYDKETAKYNLELDMAKDAEDWETWDATAEKKIKALEKLRDSYNKEGQSDEVDKKQLEIENLKQTRRKYASYGGAFTKGKKGGSGRGGRGGSTALNFSGFKTASSSKTYSPKGISVRAGGARTSKPVKKISVSKAPRV